MPVKRFKTFGEAREDLFVYNPGPEYYKSLREFFDLIEKIAPKVKYPKGVFRYKSFEDAERHLQEIYANQGLNRL